MAALSPEDRRRVKLRAFAERHGLELAGISTILMPRTAAGMELLRAAWHEVEADARAGTLTGELAFVNFGAGGDGWKPWAHYEWSEVKP
jgi:hypothetical protein